MLKVQRSPTDAYNDALRDLPRKSGEDNAAYVARHAAKSAQYTNLVLLGGTGPIDFRLRVAQAHVRDDLLPSAWSHVLLLGVPNKAAASTTVHEVALYGRNGIGFPPRTNGVAQATLGDYRDKQEFPNVAVLQIPVPFAKVTRAIERFQTHRSTIDAVEHMMAWWAYVWGVGRAQNPLLDGVGVPAAVFAEYVLAALGYDLVPGFPSRASCPEAIWLSARWWFEAPRMAEGDEKDGPDKRAVAGAYDAEHYLVPKAPGRRPRK